MKSAVGVVGKRKTHTRFPRRIAPPFPPTHLTSKTVAEPRSGEESRTCRIHRCRPQFLPPCHEPHGAACRRISDKHSVVTFSYWERRSVSSGPASERSGSLLLFVVLLLGVDLPERSLVDAAGDDLIDCGHGREHRVVLVVVLMHAIAAHEEEIFKAIEISADLVEALVGAKVSRVGLGYAHYVPVSHILCAQDADLFHFADGQLREAFVVHLPQIVGVIAEVL